MLKLLPLLWTVFELQLSLSFTIPNLHHGNFYQRIILPVCTRREYRYAFEPALKIAETNDFTSEIPNLGQFAIADVELNMPSEKQTDLSDHGWFYSLLNSKPARSRRSAKGSMRPAAGIGAFLGFLVGGPFGAMLGAAATASAVRRKDTVGDAARTASKAAGLAWDVSTKALETVSDSAVGDVLRVSIANAEKIVDSAVSAPDVNKKL